jgi:hypothetical protein
VNYFYQAHSVEQTVEDFTDATGEEGKTLLSGVTHALAGYLAAFFTLQGMDAAYAWEQEIFNMFLRLKGVEPQEVERANTSASV